MTDASAGSRRARPAASADPERGRTPAAARAQPPPARSARAQPPAAARSGRAQPPAVITEVGTPVGTARLVREGDGPRTLVLGHGAGGGVDAPDLLAARDAGLVQGLTVVRVEQPWRVAGRRIAVAPPRLDEAWLAVCATLPGPLVVGGRSAGARVACRTAVATGAVGVLALAFPLRPPGSDKDRAHELDAVDLPRLVVQGERDAFGVPDHAHVVRGADHAFAVRRKDGRTAQQVHDEVRDTVASWLQTLT